MRRRDRTKVKQVYFQRAEEVFAQLNDEHEMKLGLERMEWMLERLDHPERRMKTIHIAGTNGKGSTATMISSVLREAGYSVGLFLSPPLVSWRERIQVNGQAISEESFVRWANYIWPYVEEMKEAGLVPPSYYEVWTLIAICYFVYEANPWFVVLETGLGGRFDATNIVYPLLSVITSIGYDHREQLGDQLEQIAAEKAGIIKPGVPVVCGDSPEVALRVLEEIARERKSHCYLFDRDFYLLSRESSTEQQRFTLQTPFQQLTDLSLQLLGRVQVANAATAVMALEVLRQRYATLIEPKEIARGLAKASLPGRLEKISEQPLLLLDGAHNVDSMRELMKTILSTYTYQRLIVVSAMMKDKEIESIVPLMVRDCAQLITTSVQNQARSLTAEQLADYAARWLSSEQIHSYSTIAEALQAARAMAKKEDLILVTGSLYLVAEARLHLTESNHEYI